MAKSRLKVEQDARQRSDERFFRPGRKNAITFLPNAPALFILQRVRDEAHRFAVTYHKQLRSKQTLQSELVEIPGVGENRRKQLLRHFGSLKQIRAASMAELASVPGLPERVAHAVYDHFHATPHQLTSSSAGDIA
jgi:excinuclease ABC subunit C